MKQDEMTICQCIEYLDSMVGDDKNVKDCLDYIERKAKAMDKKLRDYKSIFEEKKETNYEHYKDEIIEGWMLDLALVDGKLKRCSRVDCNECKFNPGPNKGCKQRLIEWVKKPYKKPTYKLSRFEFDLLNTFDRCKECCLLNEIECLKKLIEKGYFNGIDPFTKVHDIIDNCEVIQ